ncbi:hypothetical protein PI124_g11155 [Phytophthora idaei]|nr:hypothetical protein PI124_g11155 [Phytophthora idaei]
MVRSAVRVPRDSEVTARDLPFKSVWRELKGEDWTRKAPPGRSLDDRYKYVRPGGHPNGTVGIDYVLGEEAVLEFYANALRRRADMTARVPDSSSSNEPAQPGDAQIAAAAEVVRVNYLPDTEAAAAPRGAETSTVNTAEPTTVQEHPGSRSRSVGSDNHTRELGDAVNGSNIAETVSTERRQSTSPPRRTRRPTRRSLETSSSYLTSPRCTPVHLRTTSPLIATSPHIGRDSPESIADGIASTPIAINDSASVVSVASGDEHSDGEDDLSKRRSELLADNNDDLNAVELDQNSDQYGAIESGDEAEKDDVQTGEYDSEWEDETSWAPDDVDDDAEETETEIAAEVLFAEHFLESFGGGNEVLAGNLKNEELRSMSATGWEDVEEPDIYEHMVEPYEPVSNSDSYPGLRQGYSGPTTEALRHGDSPVALFFFFLPVVLWQHIAACSNEYRRELLPLLVDAAYQWYRKKQRHNADLPRKTRRDIQHELETMRPIMLHQLCRFIGLLVARTIAPNREKLANHWKTTDVGAVDLARDPRAKTDRAWKIRKVVEVRQQTFARGYVAPSHLAFDEAVLPSRSSFNKMRVYMKDKTHKWGTKPFMLCSAATAYCIGIEVYCGKKQHASDVHKPDMKSGLLPWCETYWRCSGKTQESKE